MKQLTEEMKKDYVESDGTICPFCGSYDLYGGDRNTEFGVHTQNITCLSCHKEWTDVYKLVSVEQD